MQQALALLLLLAPPALCYQPAPTAWTRHAVRMSASTSPSVSRRELFSIGGAVLATVAATPAQAAKYGDFGAGSPEVLEPNAMAVDKEVLGTKEVQDSLKAIQGYQTVVKEMQAQLSSNDQLDLVPSIRKSFDFSKIRTDLNIVNAALDEDTQRGTDRLIRVVIQDITELETASALKPGKPRSARKLATMQGKLSKLEAAFSDFLKFFAF